jgi:hypothetical protein
MAERLVRRFQRGEEFLFVRITDEGVRLVCEDRETGEIAGYTVPWPDWAEFVRGLAALSPGQREERQRQEERDG